MFQHHDPRNCGYADSRHLGSNIEKRLSRKPTALVKARECRANPPRELLRPIADRAIDFFLATHVFRDCGRVRGHYEYLSMFGEDVRNRKQLFVSLSAVALAAYAYSFQHPALLEESRRQYGHALQLINTALSSREEMANDSTIVSILLLSTFETITSGNPQSLSHCNAHIRGAMTIIHLRGHRMFESRRGQQLFLHICWCLSVNSVLHSYPVPPELIAIRQLTARYLDTSDPAWRLFDLEVKVAKFRADVKLNILRGRRLLNVALDIDREFVLLAGDFPVQWRFRSMTLDEPSELVFGSSYRVYPDVWIAAIWNKLRTCRLLLHKEICTQLRGTVPQFCGLVSMSSGDLLQTEKDIFRDPSASGIPTVAGLYFLFWPLLTVGCIVESDVQRKWIVDRSRYIGRMTGIQQAFSLADVRRVKCDERLPGCARCEKYGKPCPGYFRNFKFKAGKPYRSRRVPRTDGSDSETSTSMRENNETDRGSMIPSTPVSTLSSPTINVLQGLSSVVDDLSQPYSSTSIHIVSRWFSSLPSIYGRNKTLDATVRCFTAHHISKMLQNDQFSRYSRFAYIEALSRLRKSLNAPSERLSSDIFCAVLLLCLYELFANTQDPDTWMKHAKAVSQLAEIRGPNSYKDPFDNTLLKAARGLIIMHSLFSGERCFLASERWHAVMRQRINSFSSEELENLLEEFIELFSLAPSLVHALYEIKAADMTHPTTWKKLSETLTRTLEMQNKLSLWYNRFSRIAPTPYERLSSTDDAVYPIVLHYSDLNIASLFNSYHAYMAIIHEALRTLGYPGEHEAMVAFFRDQICKSVEYSGAGLLGPYRMGFPLRVAYEVADIRTKAWIENRLMQMSRNYAAVQPKNFVTVLD
ncbi:uncharacterized protein CDV56_105574 [Aspergillus thermomutatus]|uniref:Zn(2)-C6 fungal-type domain-containing protein n=1 Tax=Aspergillus thermomutatus TaxID=41047 RepID=A0A397GPW8_ASPTH|nr:uncharacterized protein CDV56_105574 [Aspergillus thermomutatus]RHZ52835.1 hypothetical protein CDV56_105574 [Aspergillus thermomutatus]